MVCKAGVCKNAEPGHIPVGAVYSGAVSSDNIYTTHVIKFCQPVRNVPFPLSSEPLVENCGSFTRNLDDYPLNKATFTQNGIRIFGESEMVLAHIYVENYPRFPAQSINFKYLRPEGSVLYEVTVNLPIPQSEWTYWWAWAYAVVGKFDASSGFSGDEIIFPGSYKCLITPSWGGQAVIDFEVSGHPPEIPARIEIRNTQPGTGNQVKVYKNGTYYGSSLDMSYFDFNIDDTVKFEAIPAAGWKFNRFDLDGWIVTTNPFTIFASHDRILNVYWDEPVDTSGYICDDGCTNRVSSGAPYRTQAECQAGCGPAPGPLSLESDKGTYDSSETILFTARYDPKWAGKEIVLEVQETLGNFTTLGKKNTDATGVTTFNYKPPNVGNFTFVSRISPCNIIFVCENSNELQLSITGDAPCDPLDISCRLGKDIDWATIGLYAAGVYLVGQIIGGLFGGRK